jgi:hypothetical protein
VSSTRNRERDESSIPERERFFSIAYSYRYFLLRRLFHQHDAVAGHDAHLLHDP